jgi:hypothetical protein
MSTAPRPPAPGDEHHRPDARELREDELAGGHERDRSGARTAAVGRGRPVRPSADVLAAAAFLSALETRRTRRRRYLDVRFLTRGAPVDDFLLHRADALARARGRSEWLPR